MNATPVVSLAPNTPDLTQISGAAADSSKPAGNGQDFAAALSDVGAKTARKPAASKSHDGGAGRQLPATGNDSPRPATAAPTPAATSAAAMNAAAAEAAASKAAISAAALNSATAAANSAAAATGAAAASATAASSALAASSAAAASSTAAKTAAEATAAAIAAGSDAGRQTGASGAAAIAAAQAEAAGGTPGSTDDTKGSASAANSGAAFAQALGLPSADAQTDQTALPSSLAQAIRNVSAGHVPDSARASAASKSPNGSTSNRVAAANAASPGVNADDDAAPSANIAPSAGGAAQAAPSAAAIAMSAAANSAVAPGVVPDAQPSSSSADDSTTPVEGGIGQPAAGTAGLPAPPALGIAAAVAAAATKAAAGAQAVAALANAGASDRHARGESSDSSTSTTAGAVAGSAPGVSSGSADAVPVPTLKVAAGVDTAEFGQGVADRVSYMVDNNLSGAKLQVNPPQLGPIEVRIAVQGDHAQVWLTSHSAVTRDALESSSPKLREMLGSQGFGQVSVDISQRSFQERPSQAQTYDWTPSADRSSSAAPVSTAAASPSRISSSAVDAYA